jgi:hypothetical protein
MKARGVLAIAIIAALVCLVLVIFLVTFKTDTTFEFRLVDSVSGRWVWGATARLQDRVIVAFYQSDAGPIPFTFTHLKPGKSTFSVTAAGYEPVQLPLTLARGSNLMEKTIEMRGYEIPNLDHFVVFEEIAGGDLTLQLRPVGTDGAAVLNHPCIPLWISGRISVELESGVPAAEPADSVGARGKTLFQGQVPWKWDSAPETTFRYTARIMGGLIAADDSPYRVADYLIIVPDPRKIGVDELNAIMRQAPPMSDIDKLSAYLDREKGRVRYFFDTSWNVKAGSE